QPAMDVKLLAASPHDLGGLAAGGRFREDLYHRLAVVVLTLPPLRERGDDILRLARALLERFAAGYGARAKTLVRAAPARLPAPRVGGTEQRHQGPVTPRTMTLRRSATRWRGRAAMWCGRRGCSGGAATPSAIACAGTGSARPV